jgi:DNA-binding transcriptional MerR regulator
MTISTLDYISRTNIAMKRTTYTVKQVAELAGVSVRTLHYYDEIGLLAPSAVRENGYRLYGEEALLRLQQILFFRELDFSLNEIRDMLDRPGFDMEAALALQREALANRVRRLTGLIETIDNTMRHLKGETTMSAENLFAGFDEAKQAEYEEEIRTQYGDTLLNESRRNWARYTAADKERIKQEGSAIYLDLVALIDRDPAAPEVQAVMRRWHQHLRHFYEPPRAVLQGLGQMYAEHPEFVATFQRMHPDLPEFLRRAVAVYAETADVRA